MLKRYLDNDNCRSWALRNVCLDYKLCIVLERLFCNKNINQELPFRISFLLWFFFLMCFHSKIWVCIIYETYINVSVYQIAKPRILKLLWCYKVEQQKIAYKKEHLKLNMYYILNFFNILTASMPNFSSHEYYIGTWI